MTLLQPARRENGCAGDATVCTKHFEKILRRCACLVRHSHTLSVNVNREGVATPDYNSACLNKQTVLFLL